MPSHQKSAQHPAENAQMVPSKDMPPMPKNFGPVFFQNQFRTKIDLPTKQMYPDIKGKCAIITGSNSGLGLEASRQLLSLGLSHLVMGVRSLSKGDAAAIELRTANPSAKIEVWQLDMDSYDSIQAFARKCQDDLPRIDMVILNAGLSPLNFTVNPETGHEETIQINHFGTVLLATLLLPTLKSKSTAGQHPPPRLTIVNSVTAHTCKFPNRDKRPLMPSFDDTAITPWDALDRYGVSKLICQLFVVKLAEQVDPKDVVINMVDPGLTKGTRLGRDATGIMGLLMIIFFSIAGRPVQKGAATYVDAVLGHGKETHGCFLMNCKIAPLAGWFYTDGRTLTDLIWTETLQDLKFAGVEQILASLRS